MGMSGMSFFFVAIICLDFVESPIDIIKWVVVPLFISIVAFVFSGVCVVLGYIKVVLK